ncbi:MAG: hypothetical protein HFG20_09910 [Anaerotruncus sp.]|nr:hypothetical protein [Anaerotruncus sp.]
MPFISTNVSIHVTNEQEMRLKARFGKAIEKIPGKSEAWLMCDFRDRCRLYFKGDNGQPCAFVQVKIFGRARGEAYDQLTAELTRILAEELSISADRIYIQYQECEYWGWNGRNF